MKGRKQQRHVFAHSLFAQITLGGFIHSIIFLFLLFLALPSQAAISFVGSGTADSRESCGDINPSMPAGSVGDLLIALAMTKEDDAGNTVTMNNWNTYYSADYPGAGDDNEIQARIFWRIATTTNADPNTINQAGGACVAFAGQIARFSGVDTASPFETVTPGVVNQDSGDIDTGTITTISPDAMLLVAAFVSDDRAVAEDGAWTETFEFTFNGAANEGDLNLTLNHQLQTTAGNKSISNWDLAGGGNDENFGVIFALTPQVIILPSCSFNSGLVSGFPGQYFNNMTLTNPPADTRVDGPVNFDWGGGTPGVTGVGADNFSVRWEGVLRITTTDTYRFQTVSDDGVRLYVDNVLVIDNWTNHAATTDTSGDVALTAGQVYSIRLEFFENGGQAEIRLRWGDASNGFTYTAIPAGPSPAYGEGLYYCTPSPIAEWQMEEFVWNGTAGEVIDQTGSYNGTAVNGAQTDDTTPAIAGSPGTCRYGTFDDAGGGIGDYVEIAGFPDQVTDFTITAWINTQDNTRAGQRIFADDESNTGGYALSVGDGGTGTLRFYSRNVNNVILDTGNLITSNTWYFVASVADITNSQRTLYIYNTAGTLVGTATDTFTGAWGTDNGTATIGGESNSGETDNRFFGNIDEVRFYDSVLSQTEIETVLNETHDCPVAQNIILSTTNNSTIGGQGIDQDEAVEYDPITDAGTLFLNDATFDANEDLDAIHALNDGSGNLVISTAGGAGINGNNFNDGDLVEVSPSGTPGVYNYVGVFFPESNFSGGADIDAVYVRNNGNIVLSTDNNEQLPQCGGGNLNFSDDELVEWDVTNSCATLVFDFGTVISGCGGGSNIVGVHYLNDDENTILISTEGNCTIDGSNFEDGDIVLYNRNSSSASLYLDEGQFSSGDENINALTLATPVISIHHYAISHSGSGITCDASVITITAHDSSDNPIDVPGGTVLTINAVDTADGVTLAGQFANAVGGGSLGGAGNPVTYTWPSAPQENSFTIELRQLTALTLNINLDDGSAVDKGNNADPEDQDIVFTDAIFRITNNPVAIPVPETSITTKISGKSSNSTGFGQQTLYLQAIRTDDESGSCSGVFQNQTATIQMAGECNNPATCAGTAVTVQDNTTSFIPIGINNNTMVPPTGSYQNVTLDFDANSAAPLVFNYADAGQITLHARYDIDPDVPVEYMFGGSNPFVVRPFAFSIESGDVNFTAADANGTAFRKAGENFDVIVQSVIWQSADDANNDGVPNTGVDLTDNAVTPNFGNETVAPTVDISHTLALPTGGSAGTLTGGTGASGFGSVNPGETTATLSFSEVGIIDLTATHTSYLGTGSNITGTRESIGRFYPARFQVTDNNPDFADACTAGPNPFTYMGQTFFFNTEPQLTVTALNTAGNPTNNYGDTSPVSPGGVERFWKLPATLPRSYADTTGHGPANFTGLASATVTLSGDLDFADGSGTLVLANDIPGLDRDSFLYTRTIEEIPFAVDVNITFNGSGFTDTDGVCYDDAGGTSCNTNDGDTADPYVISNVGNTEQRFGRLVILSAAGSELLPVVVPVRTEYFTPGGFATNTDGMCMSLPEPDINLTSAVGGPVAGGPVDISNAAGCADGNTSITISAFSGGEAGLNFTAPGEECTGYADITLDLSAISLNIGPINYPSLGFLRYDWDDDGNHDNDPSGRATFGVFEGPRELIYFREPW